MNLVLFDDHSWDNLLPLTFTRPVSGLRVGILTIAEKWEKHLRARASFSTREYLGKKFPLEPGSNSLLINGALLPDEAVLKALKDLPAGSALKKENILLGARDGIGSEIGSERRFGIDEWLSRAVEYIGEVSLVDYPWKIFGLNGQEIGKDFNLVTGGRASGDLSPTVQVIGNGNIFVEPGFKGEYITLNTSGGPVYLGAESEIMEGSVIRGPFALCERAIVKMQTKIYGPTTIGPSGKAGGEINNSVILGNSNKAHDGFLGNSVIGEWCNLGADTNNSNLKNNYSEVKIWNYLKKQYIGTNLQFCGLIMGDHSKCGINTMFNTGTVVGVSANIFGSGFPGNFIPSFSWGGSSGYTTYRLDKMMETAGRVTERKGEPLHDYDRAILEYIFDFTRQFRKW